MNLAGKRAFVISDQHYASEHSLDGGIDPYAESCALQAIEIVNPDIAINIGDVGEWEPVSHWRYKKVKRPPLQYQLDELQKEVEVVNAGLDRWDELFKNVGCKTKHMIEGNHERWIDNLCLEYPMLKKDYSPQKLMKLRERGYKYHPYGKYIKFGKLAMYHGGHFTSKYHAHKHVTELGHNVMYGHTHDQQTAKIPTLGGFRGAWSIGCLSKMNKPFLKGQPTNWSHAFAIVHFLEKGHFNVEIVEILDGVCHVWGNKIKG